MRGEHGRDQRIAQELGHRLGPETGGGHPLERQLQRAVLRRRAGQLMRPVPAVVMQILGDAGELREVSEGADHRHRGRRRQPVQDRLQLGARLRVAVAPEADRRLADLLDQLESVFALLLAQRVAQQPPQ